MEIKDVEELFIDTNVLIFATDELSMWHRPANESLQTARQLGIDLVISPQIVREYLAAATRESVEAGRLPLSEILENARVFQAEFKVVDDNQLVLATLSNLLGQIPVAGKQVHDANIVATMLVHGIRHLLTHNVTDFARFSRFITVVPLPMRL